MVAVLAACSALPSRPASSDAAPTVAPAVETPSEQALPAAASGAPNPPAQSPATETAGTSSEEPTGPSTAEPAQGTEGTAAPQEPNPPDDDIMESARRSVRSTAEWLARGVDSWFGDKPFEQGGKVTDGRLSVALLKRADASLDKKVRFNVRLRLPNVEEQTYLFVGRDNDREVVADTPGALSRQDRLLAEAPEDRTFFAGIGYALREAFDVRLGFHGIKPYAQARYRQPWNPTPRDLIEFRQTFFWRISDHFGSTTALSYEHAYSSTLAVRWLSATTATQKSRQFDWSSILGTYKGFEGERLLSLEYVASGAQHTGTLVSEHGALTKWSQPVFRDWLFGEAMVGLYWPRRELDRTRDRVWAFGGSVTMRF